MKFSYAICVCDEHKELDTLLDFLFNVKHDDDEIVILVDSTKNCRDVTLVLAAYTGLRIFSRAFNNDFSQHKNFLNSKCRGEYIFSIDADEVPTEQLVEKLYTMVEEKPDAIYIPRINICLGQTAEFLKRHGFCMNELGWINWPDCQGRIYRNHKDIYWQSDVHERIGGPQCKNIKSGEMNPLFTLLHVKTVKKQDKQHDFYEAIICERIEDGQV